MKKLSFLMAMILILSSLFAVPVFAANAYTFDGTDKGSNTLGKKNGLTAVNNVAGPLKKSTDTVYHVSGTSTVTDAKWYTYCFTKAVNSDTDFVDKASYVFSMDVFLPSKNASTNSEVVAQVGVSKWSVALTFRTGSYKDTDVGNGSGRIFYGLETDKWHNIVVAVTLSDGGNNVTNTALEVYKDGVKYTDHYSSNGKNVMKKQTDGTITGSIAAKDGARQSYYMNGKISLDYVIGENYNLYFDNVIYKSGVTYSGDTKATISTAVDGVVTVDAGTTAEQVADLATGASAVEVYRADSSAFGFAQVTDAVAKDDIIKLVTANGSYSYYTLDVKEEVVVNPFVVGELTAPALNPAAGSTVSASLALSGDKADKNVTLILCVYKGITLIDIKTASITKDAEVTGNLTTDSITVPSGAGNYTAKAFVWDTLTGMQWVPTN